MSKRVAPRVRRVPIWRVRCATQKLAMPNVTLKVMDATSMDFAENEFDKALATYTISAVPDPVAVLREMRRVVKPGGEIVILNHFRSERRFSGRIEDLVAPVCTRLGWKSNLAMAPLLREVGLTPEFVVKVNGVTVSFPTLAPFM